MGTVEVILITLRVENVNDSLIIIKLLRDSLIRSVSFFLTFKYISMFTTSRRATINKSGTYKRLHFRAIPLLN